jgi:hypothetical protein
MKDDDDFAISESNMSKSFFGGNVGLSFQSAGGNNKPKNMQLPSHNITSTALPGAILSSSSKANPIGANSAKSSPVETTAKSLAPNKEKEADESAYSEDGFEDDD